MLTPTGGVKIHVSKRTEGIRLKREGKKGALLDEYLHSTLTSIRQENGINYLIRHGVPKQEAIKYVRIELRSYPLARIGEGYGSGQREKRDHGIPQKRSGLNKVTIMEFTKKGKQYSPRLFQVNVNGEGAYFPANKELATEQALDMIETAKIDDKRGHKIGGSRRARDEEEAIFAKKYTVKKINEPVKHFEGKMYVVQSHGQDVTFPMTFKNANAQREKLIEHKDRLT